MANEKELKSRVVHKHDTEINWNKAVNFIPKAAELIIYDTDENNNKPRLKIGNGVDTVTDLPFSMYDMIYTQPEEPLNAPLGALWLDTDEEATSQNESNLSDWNASDKEPGHILNRTHYLIHPAKKISWDGDMTDKFIIDPSMMDEEMQGVYFVKVSDEIFTADELINGQLEMSIGSGIITKDSIINMPEAGVLLTEAFLIIYSSSKAASMIEGATEDQFPVGTYFISVPEEQIYVKSLITSDYVKTLDEKYLPKYLSTNVPRIMPPKYNISWDGDTTNKLTLDLTPLGYEGQYLAKISDLIIDYDELINSRITESVGIEYEIAEGNIDNSTPGIYRLSGGAVCVVYSVEDVNSAYGFPEGYLTNGIYFVYVPSSFYISNFATAETINYLDEKYLPDTIARIEDVNILINNAIQGAIGGSY